MDQTVDKPCGFHFRPYELAIIIIIGVFTTPLIRSDVASNKASEKLQYRNPQIANGKLHRILTGKELSQIRNTVLVALCEVTQEGLVPRGRDDDPYS